MLQAIINMKKVHKISKTMSKVFFFQFTFCKASHRKAIYIAVICVYIRMVTYVQLSLMVVTIFLKNFQISWRACHHHHVSFCYSKNQTTKIKYLQIVKYEFSLYGQKVQSDHVYRHTL